MRSDCCWLLSAGRDDGALHRALVFASVLALRCVSSLAGVRIVLVQARPVASLSALGGKKVSAARAGL